MNDLLQCWCAESVPPRSVFQITDILDPSALAVPIFVVQKGASFSPLFTTAFHYDRAWGGSATNEVWWRTMHLRPDVLTNGIIAVPAKTVFSAKPLSIGIHWLAYHEDTVFQFQWFLPVYGQWTIIDATIGENGNIFRQVGYRDEINKCIPVIMEPSTWVHTFDWSV